MSSINRIKREQDRRAASDQRCKSLAALFLLIAQADAYQLTKKEGGRVVLKIHKGLFSTTIEQKEINEIVQPLGDWLMSLPKGVWD